MVEIPTVVLYIGIAALIVVCAFLGVLLYFLIKLTRIAIRVAQWAEESGRRIESDLQRVRRAFNVASVLWRSD